MLPMGCVPSGQEQSQLDLRIPLNAHRVTT